MAATSAWCAAGPAGGCARCCSPANAGGGGGGGGGRDTHEDIYDMLDRTLNDFDDISEAAAHLIKFELAMLTELGFGLDLENCAATGETSGLVYVSPKYCGAESRRPAAH